MVVSVESCRPLSAPITVASMKADGTGIKLRLFSVAIAFSCGDEKLYIAVNKPAGWKVEAKLLEHDQRITGVDWHTDNSSSDRILSCSADRTGFVWSRSKGSSEWTHSLAALRLRKGATCARWNQTGSKFAVGGAEGIVAIGHYDSANDWWICKHLKKHFDGPISSVAWHPNGLLLAAASEQGVLYLVDSSIPAVDNEAGTFDGLIGKFELGKAVSFISFSPSGSQVLCLFENQSHVAVIDVNDNIVREVPGNKLPFISGVFLSDHAILLSNFVGAMTLGVVNQNGDWKFESNLVPEETKSSEGKINGFQGAMSKFRMMDSKGLSQESASESLEIGLKSSSPGHSDIISALGLLKNSGKAWTSGLDGKIILWDLNSELARVGIEGL